MTPKQVIAAIGGMRDREALSQIIWAAEARDNHLSSIESDERRKRAWSHFSHLRKGDIVFVHKEPGGAMKWLYGRPLRVKRMKPRVKEIVIAGPSLRNKGERAEYALSALVALDLKLSEVATSDALANSLNIGEES